MQKNIPFLGYQTENHQLLPHLRHFRTIKSTKKSFFLVMCSLIRIFAAVLGLKPFDMKLDFINIMSNFIN